MEGIITTIIATVGSVVVAALPLLQKAKKERELETAKILEARQKETDIILASVNALRKDLSHNNQLTVSAARSQLESIYRKYEKAKRIPKSSWKAVCELHEAYKLIILPNGHKPNSWADSLYQEMEGWEKE